MNLSYQKPHRAASNHVVTPLIFEIKVLDEIAIKPLQHLWPPQRKLN